MSSTYLVLKRLPSPARDVWAGGGVIGRGTTMSTSAFGVGAAGVRLSVGSVPQASVHAVTALPDTVAVAPVVPMKLIGPVPASSDGAPEAEAATAWGLHAVGADRTDFTGEGVVVAVVDTGIDADHPAFAGVQLIQADFTGEGIGDGHGHGTHCAGTIFGRPVNGTPIGIAPGVTRAVIAKVLNSQGSGSSDDIVKGILWAVEQGAHIISMSIGMDFPGLVKQLVAAGLPEDLATSRALEGYRANTRLFDSLSAMVASGALSPQGTIIVAAAGNESHRNLGPEYELAVAPPAVAEGIVSVGALGQEGGSYKVAYFSNTGPNICGPGVNILSAKPGGGLQTMSGTSMATPHVAGVAALWAQKLLQNGGINDFQLISRVAGNSSTELIAAGTDAVDVGAGMVQAP